MDSHLLVVVVVSSPPGVEPRRIQREGTPRLARKEFSEQLLWTGRDRCHVMLKAWASYYDTML